MKTGFHPFLLLVLFISLQTQAETLVIEGKYQNKNILVHNGSAGYGVGFCTKEIKVNGNITTDETNSAAFEIDLAALHLRYGEKVVIEIVHDKNCTPKILNLEDLYPKPTFETLAIQLNKDGLLTWTTKNESGSLPFVIEQFKWNKWIPVGEVDGLGTAENHQYRFKVVLHSGENTFRLRQKGFNASVKVSESVHVISGFSLPVYTVSNEQITFDRATAFEVYDIYGMNLIKGFGESFSIAGLKVGHYYLSYDNKTVEFRK
jgi:hypothetical protein